MRRLPIATVILGLMASAGHSQDTPAHFHATARLQLLTQLHNGTNPKGVEIDTAAESIDLTKQPPVMLNRWAVRFPYIELEPWTGWTNVTGMCDGDGHVLLLISGWGMVTLAPSDRAVWEAMGKQMSFETRWQKVIITAHEILVEEPLSAEAR